MDVFLVIEDDRPSRYGHIAIYSGASRVLICARAIYRTTIARYYFVRKPGLVPEGTEMAEVRLISLNGFGPHPVKANFVV